MCWQLVSGEMLHKNIDTVEPVGLPMQRAAKFYLNEACEGVYFTQREAQTMWLLLHGYTIREVGDELSLSPRTIEYYLRNMKAKLNCRTKAILIRKVMGSHFLKAWQLDGAHDQG